MVSYFYNTVSIVVAQLSLATFHLLPLDSSLFEWGVLPEGGSFTLSAGDQSKIGSPLLPIRGPPD